MIKAVIFDMDGLLIDSEPLWRRAQLKAYQALNIHPTPEDFNHTMGQGIDDVVKHWYHVKPWQGPSQTEIVDVVIADLLELVKQEGQLRPGVHQALELCKAQSLPLAIASSSSSQIIDTVVDTLDLRRYFQVLYSAEHEPYSKPHPGVFISTAKRLKVDPRFCLVFEDAPSGVLAAKAAKMTCIAVPQPDVKDHKFIRIADVIIDSLEEFDEAMLTARLS